MYKYNHSLLKRALLGALVLACSTLAIAAETGRLAAVNVDGASATFQPLVAYSSVRVTITGPDGFEVTDTFQPGTSLSIPLPGFDGLYKYEVSFSPVLSAAERSLLASARASDSEVDLGPGTGDDLVQSGTFSLAGGGLVADTDEPVSRAGVIGDTVIHNSLCVGFDCPTSPSFSDTTILLMENNTRIKFDDTSTISGFPNRDWEIQANSTSSGGASYLGINDCGTSSQGGCANDLVFAVEAGAPQNALYVESDGDVGFGTSNPVVDLHVVDGNTPTLRLDQNGTSGFAPQVWDVAGNETSFFVRDATNGSALPFRIRPGASSNALVIDGDSEVGIGVLNASAKLNVVKGDTSGTPTFTLGTTGRSPAAVVWRADVGNEATTFWNFTVAANENSFIINRTGGNGTELTLTDQGDLTITGGLVTGTAGSCTAGTPCDGVFEPDFKVQSIDQHASYMWKNRHLPGVGPTPPDQPINLTQKTTGILNELEKAHIYIEQLSDQLARKDAELANLNERLKSLEDWQVAVASLLEDNARIAARLEELEGVTAVLLRATPAAAEAIKASFPAE